jgi:hypothetical protein
MTIRRRATGRSILTGGVVTLSGLMMIQTLLLTPAATATPSTLNGTFAGIVHQVRHSENVKFSGVIQDRGMTVKGHDSRGSFTLTYVASEKAGFLESNHNLSELHKGATTEPTPVFFLNKKLQLMKVVDATSQVISSSSDQPPAGGFQEPPPAAGYRNNQHYPSWTKAATTTTTTTSVAPSSSSTTGPPSTTATTGPASPAPAAPAADYCSTISIYTGSTGLGGPDLAYPHPWVFDAIQTYCSTAVDFSFEIVDLGACTGGCSNQGNWVQVDWNDSLDRICSTLTVPVTVYGTTDGGVNWSDKVDVLAYFPDGATYGTYPAYNNRGFTSSWPVALPWTGEYNGNRQGVICY